MLIKRGYAKVGENHQKDKYIVDAEGPLDEITRQEFEGRLRTAPKINSQIEEESQGNPNSAPHEWFFYPNDMSLAVENSQVQRQHYHHEDIKSKPWEDLVRHPNSLSVVNVI